MNAAAPTKLDRALAIIAPGTAMRHGLERIVHGGTGALIVLGETPEVAALCTGGFALDVPFTATALRELAKMDGAIVLADGGSRIVRAGVHLMPIRRWVRSRPAPGTAAPIRSPVRPAFPW